jgi:hypothetical protein
VRFGLIILADQRWRESARRWRRAEEYGFDHADPNVADGGWLHAGPRGRPEDEHR